MPDQSAASSEDSEGLGRTFASIMLGQLGRGLVQFAAFLDGDGPHGGGCDCDEPEDSPRIESFRWEARFASDVPNNALVALDGRVIDAEPGLRALRVTQKRAGERQGPLGGPVELITFLVVDLDSDEPHSLTLSPDSSLRVAVEVPDSVADLDGGA
jgi:hypothetical protein